MRTHTALAQGARHGIERVPTARSPPGAAVHHQVVGAFSHLGVEVVVQHAVRRFLLPTERVQLRAARGAYGARTSHSEHLQVAKHMFHCSQHAAVSQQRLGRTQIGREPAIGAGARHRFA